MSNIWNKAGRLILREMRDYLRAYGVFISKDGTQLHLTLQGILEENTRSEWPRSDIENRLELGKLTSRLNPQLNPTGGPYTLRPPSTPPIITQQRAPQVTPNTSIPHNTTPTTSSQQAQDTAQNRDVVLPLDSAARADQLLSERRH